MGCLFGARLAPHADVTLIGGWQDQIKALRDAPLRVVHPDGHEEFVRVQTSGDYRTVQPVDVALIATKAPKTELAARQAAYLLAPSGLAISLQNGLGNQEIIGQWVDPQRVTLGITTLGASTNGQPGVVYWNGHGSTSLATRPAIDAQVRDVAQRLERGTLPVNVVEDVSSLVWGKLAVNAAINPLTAVLRVPNGALLDSAWASGLLRQTAAEVAATAAAQNVTLPFPDAAAQAEQVARLTARNTSSMLQDVLRGVETEIEAICGAVVRAAEPLGIETPANRLLYALVKAIEETYPARK
jgi:2-dehydropantoate 2-reductase